MVAKRIIFYSVSGSNKTSSGVRGIYKLSAFPLLLEAMVIMIFTGLSPANLYHTFSILLGLTL